MTVGPTAVLDYPSANSRFTVGIPFTTYIHLRSYLHEIDLMTSTTCPMLEQTQVRRLIAP